jgi:hypothetical protein
VRPEPTSRSGGFRGSLAALIFVACAFATGARGAAHVDDVEYVDAQHLATGAAVPKAAVGATRIGNVLVVDVTGDYSRGNTPARQSVAQAFFQSHVDDYDFLIAFTTFEFETGDFRAFYNVIRNDVSGIGAALVDLSASFGSNGRLQGYIDMAASTRWVLNPADPRYDDTLDTFAHELMHRWAVYPRYRTPAGSASGDLLGRQGAHWSYFADSDASVMFGNDWRERVSGEFEAVDVDRRYNDVELYLAGLKAPSEVAPMALIRGGTGSADDLPRLGATTPGQLEQVTLQQIIDQEGPRVPAMVDAPKEFRAALLLLRRPGEAVDPVLLTQLERFRIAAQRRFAQFTRGRGVLRIEIQPRETAAPGLPAIVQGSGDATTPAGAELALAWLKSRQFEDGHWQDRPSSAIRDTATAIEALEELDPSYEGISRARAWLLARSSLATTDRAWRLMAVPDQVAEVSVLRESQLASGAFGLRPSWQGSPADSLVVARVLAARPATRAQAVLAARWLVARQSPAGGLPATNGGRALAGQTAELVSLLDRLDPVEFAPAISSASGWLADRIQDGGFGDEVATVSDSASVLRAEQALSLPPLVGS